MRKQLLKNKPKDELLEIVLKEFNDLEKYIKEVKDNREENLLIEVNRPKSRINKKKKTSRMNRKEFLEMLKDDLW